MPEILKTKVDSYVLKWLDDHGGRNSNDLKEDKDGLFVMMWDGFGGELKIYCQSKLIKLGISAS
jgi:hypothetical protein